MRATSVRLALAATAVVGAALFAGMASDRASALGPLSASSHCGELEAGIHASVARGEGTVDPTEACLAQPGTVAFTATPAQGWRFAAWRGDCADTGGARCWVRADPPNQYSIEAFFARSDSPPTDPANLRVVDTGQTRIVIAWDASSDDGAVTGYDVFLNGEQVGAVDATKYEFGGLACGTVYKLSVRARDDTGNVSAIQSVEGSTDACATGDREPPSTPSGLNPTSAQPTSVALSWNASSDNVGVTGYEVLVNGAPAATVTETSHVVTGLACSTRYTFGVRARDAAGNASGIAAVDASTASCPSTADTTAPSAPSGLVVTSTTPNAIGVSWGTSTDDVGVTGYDVLVNGAQRTSVAATTAVLGELACSTSYQIGVRARDAAGNVSGTTSTAAATAACAGEPPPGTQPPGEPTIGDAGTPPGPDELPPPARDLLVSVVGASSKVVVLSGGSRALFSRVAAPPIACGGGSFRCAARLPSGTTVRLAAKAAPGSRLVRWTGACSGSAPTCRVRLTTTKTVGAVFAPRNARSIVGVSLARPSVRVRWSRSVGRAAVVVRGRVARAAVMRVQIRRPGGGPLVTQVTQVLAGRFRLVPRLAPGLLPRGASVFPGGFVVTLRGRSGPLRVPLQIQTVVLAAPPEGVVRRAFVSNAEEAPAALRLPAGATQAWAHFRFEAQPRAGRRLSVAWYRPNGTLIGVVDKANRPEVVSFLRSDTGIASGAYRAELRAGDRVVKVLSVRIG